MQDQVHGSGFVFERDKGDPLGRTGALPEQHQPGHLHRAVIGNVGEPVDVTNPTSTTCGGVSSKVSETSVHSPAMRSTTVVASRPFSPGTS
jgi:hypothetical protein